MVIVRANPRLLHNTKHNAQIDVFARVNRFTPFFLTLVNLVCKLIELVELQYVTTNNKMLTGPLEFEREIGLAEVRDGDDKHYYEQEDY